MAKATAGCSKCRYAARGCGRCVRGSSPRRGAGAPGGGEATGARRRAARAARRERARGGVRGRPRGQHPRRVRRSASPDRARRRPRRPRRNPRARRASPAPSAKKAPPRGSATRRIPGPAPRRSRDRRPRLRRRERRPAAPPRLARRGSHHHHRSADVKPRRLETLPRPRASSPADSDSLPAHLPGVPPARRDPASLVPGRPSRPERHSCAPRATTQLCGGARLAAAVSATPSSPSACSAGSGGTRASATATSSASRSRRNSAGARRGGRGRGRLTVGATLNARRRAAAAASGILPPRASSPRRRPRVRVALRQTRGGSGRTLFKAACELGGPSEGSRVGVVGRGVPAVRSSGARGARVDDTAVCRVRRAEGRGRRARRRRARGVEGADGEAGEGGEGGGGSEGTRAVVRERHGVGSYDREATNESERRVLFTRA